MKISQPLLLLAALLALAPASAALADDDRLDQERARRALLEGRIKPLSEITEIVSPRLPGKVIGVELEVEKGRFVYEFNVIDSRGKLLEVDVDAATGKILSIEDDD